MNCKFRIPAVLATGLYVTPNVGGTLPTGNYASTPQQVADATAGARPAMLLDFFKSILNELINLKALNSLILGYWKR